MRLLSLAPSNTEILFALGVGDQLVGITNLCDYPKETKNIQKLGSWIYTEPKKITELNPDFIFTSTFIPESLRDWPASLSLKRGEKGPGKIIHVEPKTLMQVYQSIKNIAKVVQKSRTAEDLIKTMQKELSSVAKRATLSPRLRIYAEEWPSFVPQSGTSAGKAQGPLVSGNWVPELISIAGGTAGLSEQGKPSSTFLLKNLEKFDPDLMIFHWCGADFWRAQRDKRSSPAIRLRRRRQAWQWSKSVENRPGWEKLRAVAEKKFFVIDDSLLNRPGPRLTQGAKLIQKCIQKYGEDLEAK